MRAWHIARMRLRSLLLRDRSERELQEELRLHLELETERRVAQGLDPHAARQRAAREFGAVESFKEECRDARGTAVFDALARDVRHGLRRLVRDWHFTAAAVLILGLGIGINTSIFSVVNAALFRASLVADPERLVEIYQNAADGSAGISSYPAYQDVAQYTGIFAGVTAVSVPIPAGMLDQGSIRTAIVEYTTANYLSVLGLRPWLGRWFTPAEDAPGAAVVAIVSHRAWSTRFNADPSIVGRTLQIEGTPVTIVGVGPAGHNGTVNLGLITDFWIPIAAFPALGGPPRALERRPVESPFFIKARLRDGVTVAQARAAMDILGARLAREYPNEDPGRGITVVASSDVRVHPQMDIVITALASVLLTVVGLVLALACSNLATLLLVRGAARAKEVSIRLALGASRWQLIRHLLTESVLLALAGGAAGCVLAWWGIRAIGRLDLPLAVDFSLDARVLAFAITLSLLTGVTFGLAPALKGTKIELLPTLRDDGAPSSRDRRWFTLKNALVVFQVVVSIVLLSASGVFLDLLTAARGQQTGFAVDGVAMLETDARFAGYSAGDAENVYEEIRRRVGSIPGVQAVTIAAGAPMVTTGLPLVLDDAGSGVAVQAGSVMVGPGYFETLQIPILFGRALDDRDRPGAPRAAVISESMARRFFDGANAVGRRLRIDQDPDWIDVVGVARDTKTADLEGDLIDPTPYLFYRASAQWNRPPSVIVARTSRDAASLAGAMQRELRAVDAALPIMMAKTMRQHLEESLVVSTAAAAVLGVFGILGLGLAGIGLHAVVSFAVSRRSREIGIRMALGARSGQVAWSVVRDVTVLMGAGAAIGLVLSAVVILAVGTLSVPEVGFSYRLRIDPVALAAIAGFIAAVCALAAFVPARRAATMDPLAALRHD